MPGALAIDDVTMAEGNAGTTTFTFTVTRANGSSGAVGATWTLTLSGDANAADFTAFPQTGTVSFADGSTTAQTISITVQGDVAFEASELFTVVLSAPTGGVTLADATGQGTITNDDAAPPVVTNLQGDTVHYYLFDGQTQLDAGGDLLLTDADSATFEGGTLTVSITQGAATGDVLSVIMFPGILIASNNIFVDGVIIVTFSGGTNGNPLVFNFLDEATPARVQTLMRALAFSNNEFNPGTATRQITYSLAGPMGAASATSNVDFPGTMNISDAFMLEGDFGTTTFTFTVSREGGTAGAGSATWTLNAPGGTGYADSGDFDAGQAMSGIVSFADGQSSAEIQIIVQGDVDFEDVEDFTVTLGEPITGTIRLGTAEGTGTILNDDEENLPPVVDLDGPGGTNDFATAYTEDDSAGVPIGDFDLTISDDMDTVSSVTVAIAGGIAGDVLFADIDLFSIGFAANYNAATYTLTLTYAGGLAFDHEFAEALTHIRYRHDGNDPTLNGALTTRTINVVASDESQAGAAATSVITITPLYDPPAIDLDANDNISPGTGYANTYVEGHFGVRFVDFDPLVTAEGGETVSLTFTITLTDAVAGDELFLTSGGFQGQNILMTPYNAGTGILTIYGSGTRAEWQQALGEFAFRHIGNNPTVDGTDAQRTITVTVADAGGTGNTATTVMTITPVDQAAVIGGTDTGSVTEDGTLTAAGMLTNADPDNLDGFQAVVLVGTYGGFELQSDGAWGYSLFNAAANVQALAGGQQVTDSFTIHAIDGTAHDVVITVNGVNDAAAIGGTDTGIVAEDGTQIATGTLTVSDPDAGQSAFQPQTAITTAYGNFWIAANGGWSYNLDNDNAAVQALNSGQSLTDTIQVLSADGTSHDIAITIEGADEPPPPPPVVDLDSDTGGIDFAHRLYGERQRRVHRQRADDHLP